MALIFFPRSATDLSHGYYYFPPLFPNPFKLLRHEGSAFGVSSYDFVVIGVAAYPEPHEALRLQQPVPDIASLHVLIGTCRFS